MRVLIVHNHYGNYAFGGEGQSVKAEVELLESKGHEVYVYERTNAELHQRSLAEKLRAFRNIPWSPEGYAAICGVIDDCKPDIMHVNNYKYLLSPSVFAAAKDRGVATVLTMRNYRLVCPAGMFLRRGHICEDCLGGFPYRMLWRRCASDSVIGNAAQFYLYWGTRRRKLLTPWVDAYIALTEFARDRFVKGGGPGDRVYVKPNSMEDPGEELLKSARPEHRAIYVGRLSPEKGLKTLLEAWQTIDYSLVLVGDGPERAGLQSVAPASVSFAGPLEHIKALRMILDSSFVVFPSACYEGFPRAVLEAMAYRKAVVASNLGGRPEMVDDGKTGLLFESGNPHDLRQKVLRLIERREECVQLGQRARERYLQEYTPEQNYKQLMNIYEAAIARHKGRTVRNRNGMRDISKP